jgi:hypothetical protein
LLSVSFDCEVKCGLNLRVEALRNLPSIALRIDDWHDDQRDFSHRSVSATGTPCIIGSNS